MDLIDKVIVITGASSGLGKALAVRLSTEKPKLVLLSRSASKLQDVNDLLKSRGCEVTCFSCNITDIDQIRHTVEYIVEAYGKIDVLINNAGILFEKAVEDYPVESMLELFDVNAIGAICMTQTVLPYLLKSEYGQIVDVISTAGVHAAPGASVYSATKHAVEGFHRALKAEYREKNIRIMGFYPGGMEANLFTTSAFSPAGDDHSRERDTMADMVVYMLKQPAEYTMDRVEVRRTVK